MRVCLVAATLPALVVSFTATSPLFGIHQVRSSQQTTALFDGENGENGVSGGDATPKKVIVLGGDGFCGWPTSLYLSDQGHDVVVVDNLSRRNIDTELGCDSLTPIQPPEVRSTHIVFFVWWIKELLCSRLNR